MVLTKRSLAVLAAVALLYALAGCAERPGAPDESSFAAVRVDGAQRIVSLVPAATEILFALGAGDRLVGRSHWGIHPSEARRVPDLGDGIRPSLEVVLTRRPDLVVLYESEANRDVARRLGELGVPTLRLKHDTLADLARNIELLGAVVGCPSDASQLSERIQSGLAAVAVATRGRSRIRAYYDAWDDPPITIGRGSFLDSLITIAGGENVFGDLEASAPRVSLEAILHRNPTRILVTVPGAELEGSPRILGGPAWQQVGAVAAGRISLLDRDLLGRLGPRVAEAAASIARALHPGIAILQLPPVTTDCGG